MACGNMHSWWLVLVLVTVVGFHKEHHVYNVYYNCWEFFSEKTAKKIDLLVSYAALWDHDLCVAWYPYVWFVIFQALAAACKTVDCLKTVHHLQAYFLLVGDTESKYISPNYLVKVINLGHFITIPIYHSK